MADLLDESRVLDRGGGLIRDGGETLGDVRRRRGRGRGWCCRGLKLHKVFLFQDPFRSQQLDQRLLIIPCFCYGSAPQLLRLFLAEDPFGLKNVDQGRFLGCSRTAQKQYHKQNNNYHLSSLSLLQFQ